MELEQWIAKAKELGFTSAGPLNTATLETREDVRETCDQTGSHLHRHA